MIGTASYTGFKCQNGYLCDVGSSSATGSRECPTDSYCIEGTQTTCPSGYYSTLTGLKAEAECQPCPPGKYCPNFSVGVSTCDEGYYCPGKLTTMADATPCDAGHYCPAGSALPTKCEPGTFQTATG